MVVTKQHIGGLMQILSLPKNLYKFYAYARTQQALDTYRHVYQNQVDLWRKLKTEGVSDRLCQQTTGISRATFFRHQKILRNLENNIPPPHKRPKRLNKPRWTEAHKQSVLAIRRAHPTYGKNKIAIILRRDHNITMSESTVGRILSYCMRKGFLTKSPSAPRFIRRRSYDKGHARPWTHKLYKDMVMGERIQIDHMTVKKNGTTFKHFQAWDRRSKFIHANVFSHAKATAAAQFLKELKDVCPFPILSIQVDGGSEFMADFESTCQELNIPLMVLPPSKPTYNGGVERANRIFREEFYARPSLLADTIRAMRQELGKAISIYNFFRPHFALKGLTPMQYINNTQTETSKKSHHM